MTSVVFDGAAKRAEAEGRPAPTARQLGFGQPDEVAPIVVYLCSDRAAHLRSQLVTFNGTKLAVWQHPRETAIRRQDAWTLDELDAALHDAAEPVATIEF